MPPEEAEGAIAAHAIRAETFALRKGQTIGAAEVAAMRAAGVKSLIAARLEPTDVLEDAAAERVAAAIAGDNLRRDKPFTGRVNLYAASAGLVRIDVEAINAVNQIDEAITVATLAPYRRVEAGDMAATVKIIPFAVPEAALSAAGRIAGGGGAVGVAPFRPLKVAMVSTLLPGLKLSAVAKTVKVLEARLAACGSRLIFEARARHEVEPLSASIALAARHADLVVIFGASAITDRRDVIPAAIEASGGTIRHFGMPVDPGNLLLIGERDGKPLIGAPGCARSPRENGFDWVLQRVLAGVPVGRAEIQSLGVGGLLQEIASRPQPRGRDE